MVIWKEVMSRPIPRGRGIAAVRPFRSARKGEEAEHEGNGPEGNDRVKLGRDQPAVGKAKRDSEAGNEGRGDVRPVEEAFATARAVREQARAVSTRLDDKAGGGEGDQMRRRGQSFSVLAGRGCQVSARSRSSQPETAIERPTATSTFSTCERVRSRQAIGPCPESSVPGSGSGVGRMGDRGTRSVDMPPQAEYQLDLADGLAGCLGDHVGRGPLVGEGPDRAHTAG